MLHKFIKYTKKHGHHLLFGISILALAALLAWWTVFIRNSIQEQGRLKLALLKTELQYLALQMRQEGFNVAPGILEQDHRFEIKPCDTVDQDNSLYQVLEDTGFCLCLCSAELEYIKERSRDLNFMLIGEASLLTLIILLSVFFLYRFIKTEKRTHREVQAFWERSAHEIKTPITGIKAFLQNLKNNPNEFDPMQKYLDLALKQIYRHEKQTENILSGHRLQSKRAAIKLADINLTGFLKNYFTDMLLPEQTTINLNLEAGSTVRVRADRHELKVILDNLVDNAIKYASQVLILNISVNLDKKQAYVHIKDNGPGFNPKNKEKLFEAYKYIKDASPQMPRGTGLGLFISRAIAQSMGGYLDGHSEGRGKGAEFTLTLCLA